MRSLLVSILLTCILICGCGYPTGPKKEIENRLAELKVTLPPVTPPVAAYVNTVKTGKLVFVSGNLPIKNGKVIYRGKVGSDIDLATAQQSAKLCAVNALAALEAELGSLDKINRIIRLDVFVNSALDFTDQSKVANGASDFMQQVFGPAGKHSRTATGAAQLPLNAATEVAMIVEVN